MGKIIKLDERIANMIAAGEVVENIANVVKELVENAVDANATHIDVDLEESGMKKIRVTDDGEGMDEEDAQRAFERHATSKIQNEYDLFHIHSLGFRGEALPSIAAVARVTLETSVNGDAGIRLMIENSKQKEKSSGTMKKGTMIIVDRLFYRTPARYKYLKSPQRELAKVQQVINRFALSHPDIAFGLTNDGKRLFKTSAGQNQIDVLAKIYGTDTAKSMKSFRGKNRDYVINGFYANPVQNRSNASYITIIVNNRQIRNTGLTKAVREAYRQLIPLNRYPIVYLAIETDPILIDVNIHPSKQEIKFSEQKALETLVRSTLRDQLKNEKIIQPGKPKHKRTSHQEKISFAHDRDPVETKQTNPADNQKAFEESKEKNKSSEDHASNTINETPQEFGETQKPVFGDNNNIRQHIGHGNEKKDADWMDMEYIGQFTGTYLLFQSDQALYLLDQHAAAERIRYERYLKRMGEPSTAQKQLLLPLRIDVSNERLTLVRDELDAIRAFGISIEEDEEGLLLKEVPVWFPSGFELTYTEAIIETAIEGDDLDAKAIRNDLAKLLSCKHSLKANAYVNKTEAQRLITDLTACERPYTCPHGRPIMVELTIHDIEKWFKRVI